MLEIFFAHRFVFEQSNFVVASSKKNRRTRTGEAKRGREFATRWQGRVCLQTLEKSPAITDLLQPKSMRNETSLKMLLTPEGEVVFTDYPAPSFIYFCLPYRSFVLDLHTCARVALQQSIYKFKVKGFLQSVRPIRPSHQGRRFYGLDDSFFTQFFPGKSSRSTTTYLIVLRVTKKQRRICKSTGAPSLL